MPDFMNPSTDLLAGMEAGRDEMRDEIEKLHARIAELESDASSADAVMQEYAEVMQAAGCKSKAELLKKLDPPPDGYASWEDYLASKDIYVESVGESQWVVYAGEIQRGNPHSTYPAALAAAKKEAGR